MIRASAIAICLLFASSLSAEPARISDETQFRALIEGRVLQRPLVRLKVLADGQIAGTGAGWDVRGTWTWTDGYFCRDLFWGEDSLGYNCQAVTFDGERVHFTSDRGAGDSAGFRLVSE